MPPAQILSPQPHGRSTVVKMLLPSLLGGVIFFVPITLAERTTIILDHLVTGARTLLGEGSGLYAMLVIPVGLIVPIGAVFLAFLISFGLLELIGVLVQPVMRPIWRTPGRSAIDAVASFVGSYSIGLLITNRVYIAGQYSAREAAIIASGFSTVSATFMIIVAKTLDLMSVWNSYFWLTLLITFVVTAITVRLPPLASMDDKSEDGEPMAESGQRLVTAWRTGLDELAIECRRVQSGRSQVLSPDACSEERSL